MTVRAKFRCMEINHRVAGSVDSVCVEVKLQAVWGDGKGNLAWSQATPSGELKMLLTVPAAVDQFELGRDYFLDFTGAQEA